MTMRGTGFALGTFSEDEKRRFPGLVIGDRVAPVREMKPVFDRLGCTAPTAASTLELLENWDASLDALRPAAEFLAGDEAAAEPWRSILVPGGQLRVHPPVDLPRQVFCAGANYRKHVIDLIVDQASGAGNQSVEERRAQAAKMMDDRAAHGAPFVFAKPVSALTGAYDPVVLPRHVAQPDWEVELGVIIGKPARHVSRERALDHVAGYTIVNDVTNRDLVFRKDAGALGADWIAAKGLPSYLPMGPYLVPAAFVPDPQNLEITLKLNGQVMQDENTADMIFSVARIIEFLSTYVQLWPGDLIATGSPAGNGTHYNRFLRPGDVMESSITGLGTQRNPCVAEETASHAAN